MAGRAVAHTDDVFALGLQREILIKCGHAVDLGRADAEAVGDEGHVLLTEVVEDRLRVLQNGDQLAGLRPMGINDLAHTGKALVHAHCFFSLLMNCLSFSVLHKKMQSKNILS